MFNNSTHLLCSGNEDDSKKIEASATHAEKIIHAAAAADRNGGVAGLFIDTAMVSFGLCTVYFKIYLEPW